MAEVNDIVLIYLEEKPMVFARIEEILPDHKPDWYHVKLLLLQVPVQVVNWILRDIYINGEEFTMNGKRMRLKTIVAPRSATTEDKSENDKPVSDSSAKGKVISLKDLKK